MGANQARATREGKRPWKGGGGTPCKKAPSIDNRHVPVSLRRERRNCAENQKKEGKGVHTKNALTKHPDVNIPSTHKG